MTALVLGGVLAQPMQVHARWVPPLADINSTMTFDGAGMDTNIPGSFVTGDFAIGNQAEGVLNVVSGTLLINNTDGSWGSKVGHNGGTGTVNVANGATLNWVLGGTNETALAVGNQNAAGTINLNGGNLVLCVAPEAKINRNIQGLYLGGWWDSNASTARGVINLNSGAFVWTGSPGTWLGIGQAGGAPIFRRSMSGTINLNNGAFIQTGSGTFEFGGTNDTVNFISTGNGYLSILGWTRSQFDNLVDLGNLTVDGARASREQFAYAKISNQGVYQLNPDRPRSP